MKIRLQKYLVILFIDALALDIVTKLWVKANIAFYQKITVIDGFFNIVYVLNPGAAFGFLRNMDDDYRQIFFVAITVLAIVGILYLLLHEGRRYAKIGYTLVLAGAVGNLIDRINTSYVVDFLDFKLGSYSWPAFNVADICITIGVAMLIIDALFSKKIKN